MDRLDKHAPVACSLNEDDFRKRRSYARQKLIPKISKVERIENGLIFHFNAEKQLEADIDTFVELERQCCGFLTFTVFPDEIGTSQTTMLKIKAPPEGLATLEMFAQAAEMTES